ncbi:MAG: FAD-dependent oxidoreductase [Janthinobacterium lividum]
MQLGFNFSYEDLNKQEGLATIDKIFMDFVREYNLDLYFVLVKYRSYPNEVTKAEYSDLLIEISPLVDDFFSELFAVERKVEEIRRTAKAFDAIYECRRKFVQRFAIKKYCANKIKEINFKNTAESLISLCEGKITQERFVENVFKWLQKPEKYSQHIDLAARYAAYMVHKGSKICLFDLPRTINNNLLNNNKIKKASTSRFGFDYCAPELNAENALSHAHYCIYCHHQNKDSCSTGFKFTAETTDSSKNGCPLEQKISEMNQVKASGFEIAALAIIIIDNPLVAATGHRICNDCMSSCIYQKQEPVNVPLVESKILENILKLPYGLEIYLLLTRWNPLNIYYPLPKLATSYNILVTGLGPAGFGIAYHLLQEGHNVIAIDGLKISPSSFGNQPIKYWHQYKQKTSSRVPQGFGGVSEYGITNRWDKNNLSIIRLILERYRNFKAYGNIMLGGNITKQQIFELGFDYLAFCTGASQPKLPVFSNFLAKGVKTASDFLMALQNQGAFLKDNISSLTIRMPVAVIGCGLTAVDSAVEALNYYPIQVEKFSRHYNSLVLKLGVDYVEKNWTEEDKEIAREFIDHADLFREIKDKKKIRQAVIEQLGGVHVYYRGKIEDSHAFKLNYNEIAHAMIAGVKFVPNMTIKRINVDKFGYTRSVDFSCKTYPAKTVLIAIGTEHKTLELSKDKEILSGYFGDCDPQFAGSVVKALASAKKGYKKISSQLSNYRPNYLQDQSQFRSKLDRLLMSRITKINHLTSNILELIVYSPLAARNFQPGQFFRLQNHSFDPKKIIEPLALCGTYIDPSLGKDFIPLIIYGAGRSSTLCKNLVIGEEIALMGPTGAPAKILENKYIVLAADGPYNARLLSISMASKDNGCKVVYIAGYKRSSDVFYREKIEKSADIVIWCSQEDIIAKSRPQDFTIKGTILDGLQDHVFTWLISPDQIVCATFPKRMTLVRDLKDNLSPNTILELNTTSLMHCMMKGICGQCVQIASNNKSYIFGCDCQTQEASSVNLDSLELRLEQNSLQEKLAALL